MTQEPEGNYDIGSVISPIELPNPYGQVINVTNGVDKGLVLIFTNHNCNYATLYYDRIRQLKEQFEPQGVDFVAIEAKVESFEGSLESLISVIDERQISIEYLIDFNNQLSKRFKAESSPQVFLIQKQGTELALVYTGSIDNNSRKPDKVSRKYLLDALNAMISGNTILKPRTKAIGCSIDKG